MKKKISKIANILLPLLLGVFLVYYAFRQFTSEQIDEMIQYFKGANYNYIFIASIFSILSLWARAYRWKFALKYMGHSCSTTTNFMAISIGYLLNLTVPRSGEVSRALVLQKYEKVPFDKGFGSIVSERIVDLFCLLFCVLLALSLQFTVLKDFLSKYVPFEKLLILGILALVGVATIYFVFKHLKWKVITLIKNKLRGLGEGLSSTMKMPHKKSFLFYTLLIWVGYIATFYFGMHALPDTSGLSFPIVISSFVAGSFAVSFTNGGFGAFPLIIAQLLLLFDVSLVAGTAFGWILWTTQTGIVIIFGALSFLFLPIYYKGK
ncbi:MULTISPECIES: YbhN family protein [Myroides]|uniref:Flippase-like domain-containing protein n=1 Tax=Myroides albus TaxID=2562892 RepID=A0A6I3LHL5_9FLAO|nr:MULTISPECIES: lysylphosphatidylglycerol synthase transmembrane domain-containing protein [Myroides]MTG96640.1 flippase-like domain-containing protein [Myroides albus]MVX34777.1 flippase-like domain-containing protein [Myroides sp. LoEW2-1]UVD80947.1 flippase-like domain-containing protein [Myroides albus]